ncbi:MAG: PAS domain S-box protein [Spirochaetales bacterium]|nr:PAS domain S-box protein [Spirochaetales bacterium]
MPDKEKSKEQLVSELQNAREKIKALTELQTAYIDDKNRFKQLLDNLAEVFWLRDREKFIYVSPSIEKIWGKPARFFYDNPRANFMLMHPEDRDRLLAEYSVKRFQGDKVFQEEFRIVRPDGSVRWISSRSFPIKDARGTTSKRAGICEDITRRKEYEFALKEREEQLFQIFQQMPYPIEILDKQGTAVMVNKAFLKLYGITDQNILIGKFNIFKETAFRESKLFKHFNKAYKGKTVHIPESLLTVTDPHLSRIKNKYKMSRTEDVTLEITIFPIFTHTGDIWRVVSIRRDITQMAEQRQQLEQKNIALKEILAQIEFEKLEIKSRIKTNIENLVLPYVIKLGETHSKEYKDKKYLELIKNNLENISSSLIQKIANHHIMLSPRELEICDLIKNGLCTKEIAVTLSLSIMTVEKHRQHIRKKLGISHERINLHTYLHNMEKQ